MTALRGISEIRPAEGAEPQAARPSRWRAVLAGALLAAAINAFDPVSRYVIHSSSFSNSHMPFALLLGLLALAYGYNPVARRLRPGWALGRQDLAAVLAIGFLGTSIPTMAGRFVSVISAPDYFASPENEWPTYVLPNLQPWLIPSNAGDGVGGFYRGLAPWEAAPWGIWAVPLFWWFSLIAAILVGCFCMSVVLRKQWSERERLAFPLVELPLMLVADSDRGMPAFFKNRLFWIGFCIPASMLLWNTAGHFYPGLPTFAFLNNNNLLALGRGFLPLYMRFDFYVICFAYFTPLNILLSMWFFHLLATLQAGISTRIGFGPQGYGSGVITQNNYGLLIFVLWSLWTARGHFRDVWRKAVGKAPEVDDSDELVSYRTAVLGIGLAAVYVFLWLCRTGMGPGVALVYMFFSLVLYLGMAKIVALSGLVSLRGSGPTGVTKGLIGVENMGDRSIAALGQMLAMYSYAKGFCMPGAANAAKASEAAAPARRRLGGAILAGALMSLLICVGVTLALGYHGPGAENFGSYDFTTGNRHGYGYIVSEIKGGDAAPREWWNLWFGAFGAAATGLLILLSQRLPWWPLHPVGFTVSLQYPTRASFFSVFLTWLCKLLVLRVGGILLYRRSQVFFVGVLLGYALGVVVAFVLDMIFFMGQGHAMHTPPI